MLLRLTEDWDSFKSDMESKGYNDLNWKDPQVVNQILADTSLFPQQDQLSKYKDNLTWTIQRNGFNISSNPFLAWAVLAQDINIPNLTVPKINILYNELTRGEFEDFYQDYVSGSTGWLKDPRAYDGDVYKLQSLILVSNKDEMRRYGDTDTLEDLIHDILAENNKGEIADLLDKWQTKNPDTDYSAPKQKTLGAEDKDKAINRVVVLLKGRSTPDKIRAAAERVFRKGMTEAQLLYATNAKLADATSYTPEERSMLDGEEEE